MFPDVLGFIVDVLININWTDFLLQQIAVPRQDEWTRFLKTLSELGENQEEAEDLATQRLAAWSQQSSRSESGLIFL